MKRRLLIKYKFHLISLLAIFVNFVSIVLFSSDIYFIGRISVIVGGLAIIFAIRENIKNMYLEKEMLQKNYEPDPIKKIKGRKHN